MRSARRFSALIVPVALLMCPLRASAQAVLTDDASVVASSNGNANFGTNPNLNVSATRTTYLKFQLGPLPEATRGSGIARGTLQLYVGSITAPGRLDVFAIANPWDEATITADTAPPPAFLVATTDPIPLDARDHFLTIDVTSLVRQWLDDGAGGNGFPNQGLAISARNDGADIASLTFDSKENAQTSHEPRLVIQLTTAAAAGVTSVSADAPLSITDGTTTPHLTLGIVPASDGGTGLASPGAPGSFLRSAGAAWTSAPLSASDIPPGSGSYIQNGTAVQPASSFNIGGSGTATAFNAAAEFDLNGARVLAQPGNSNLYVGRGTGASSTTGAANTFVGNNAGQRNTTAIRNTFVGADAGLNTDVGGSNSFFGTDAGKQNTGGFFNAFFGDGAGGLNTTGCCNAFFGTFAGSQNTIGIRNAFFGVAAGQANTTGGSNTFVGAEAGRLNTTGQLNAFFGDGAGARNTTAFNNAFFGFETGGNVETGADNAFFGSVAGFNTNTGSRNAFFGRAVGSRNVGGADNTFVGSFADFGAANNDGSRNTLIGANTVVDAGLSNATAVGAGAAVTVSDAIVLGGVEGVNGTVRTPAVGIGTTAPRERLEVVGGNILMSSPGRGVILTSPNGTVCRRLSINDAGALLVIDVPCSF